MRAQIISLALLAGCSLAYRDDLAQQQCSEQADCDAYAAQLGTPLICRSHACQAPVCTSQRDCPRGAACVDDRCVAPADSGSPLSCARDGDCANGSRCGFDHACYPTWGCLEQESDWPVPVSDFHLRVPVRSLAAVDDPAAAGTLRATACDAADVSCDHPRVASASASVSATDAVLDVPFASSGGTFVGFVRIEQVDAGPSADADAGTLPTRLQFPAQSPLAGDFYAQHRLLTMSADVLSEHASAAGVSLVAERGTVVLQAYDCGGRAVDGVALADAEAVAGPFVTLANERVFDVTTGRTGPDGAGLLLNVPTGARTLVLRDLGANRTLVDGLTLNVAPRTLEYLYYYPRYSAVKKWLDEARQRGLTN